MPSFAELGVHPRIVTALAARGVDAPFPIQTLTLTEALAGRDLSGRAPTGSGKTLAFAIPLATQAQRGRPRRPAALVLVPTRELAAQVTAELLPLAEARGRTVGTFYGGTPISRDQRALRRGVDIAVACPGRLADLVMRGDVGLGDVGLVVLDEADRMADMGFLPEVRRLLDQTRPDRQTLLFSATLDGDVDVLVREYQRDPVRHEHTDPEGSQGAVRHVFWQAESTDRVAITSDLVAAASPAIVFTRTKHAADRVARQLQRRGVSAAAIHGNRNQSQRTRALADFTAGRVSALVATDVAARGIHVDAVGLVVHYDPAGTDKDYVHRSGRTGRAGADGVVVTLVTPDKVGDVRALQRALALPQRVGAVAFEQLTTEPPVAVSATPGAGTVAAPSAHRQAPRRGRGGGDQRPGRRAHSGSGGQGGRPRRPRSERARG